MCAVPSGTAVARSPRLELADIVRTDGEAYQRTHRLVPVQHRALRAIASCRTAALGGHRETCDHCGAVRVSYNSCLMESARFWGVRVSFRFQALDFRPIRHAMHSP